LCSNFVKFGRWKIGKVALHLPDKKFRLTLHFSLLRGSSQNLPGPALDNVLGVLTDFIQIGPFSADLYQNAWTPSKRAAKCFQYSAEA